MAVPTPFEAAVAHAGEALAAADAAVALTAADAALASASTDRERIVARRLRAQALLHQGDRAGARAETRAALEQAGAGPGPDDLEVANLHNLLGVIAKFTGEFEEAIAQYTRALEVAEGIGGNLLLRAALEHNLGGLAHSRRDFVTAEQHTRRALELHSEALGSGHPSACADRGQLGAIVSELGRHEEAIALLEQAAEGFGATLGMDHLEVAIVRTTLGSALHRAGRLDEAEAAYRAGLAARERVQGSDHPELAPALLNLGELLSARGDAAGAGDLALRAVRVLEGRVVEDHPVLRLARARIAPSAASPASSA